MADLCDDLVLQIISRLPLKYAFQCLTLNKTFCSAISHPSFARQYARSSNTVVLHCSAWKPRIFTKYTLGRTSNGSPTNSVTLDFQVSVLDSCNGVLFLRLDSLQSSHLFNPATGGLMSVDLYSMPPPPDEIGLAVDDSSVKLVALHIHQKLLRFGVIVPAGGSAKLKSWLHLSCESFTLLKHQNIRPVYAHGCLHWLGNDGRRQVIFDVDKERARLVPGPLQSHGLDSRVDMWFGLAQDTLQFVYTLPEKIVVLAHLRAGDEWQVKYSIAHVRKGDPSNSVYKNGKPLFFDGQRLFLLFRERGEDGEVHAYDVWSGEWKKLGEVGGWTDSYQVFVPYFPTAVKVSDQYSCRPTGARDCFLGLQQLLTDP